VALLIAFNDLRALIIGLVLLLVLISLLYTYRKRVNGNKEGDDEGEA